MNYVCWKGGIALMKRLIMVGCGFLGILPVVRAQSVEFKNPPELSKPNGYSHVVIVNHGRLIFVAGQVGVDKDGKVAVDFAAQAKEAFANLKIALAAAGAKPGDLVKISYFVVGLNHEKLMAIREARDGVIDKEHSPASTLAGVQALFRDDVQIEIEAEAVIP
jgi:enamine deaminase RidA (YjgF/YER057c/UK114 family)